MFLNDLHENSRSQMRYLCDILNLPGHVSLLSFILVCVWGGGGELFILEDHPLGP